MKDILENRVTSIDIQLNKRKCIYEIYKALQSNISISDLSMFICVKLLVVVFLGVRLFLFTLFIFFVVLDICYADRDPDYLPLASIVGVVKHMPQLAKLTLVCYSKNYLLFTLTLLIYN